MVYKCGRCEAVAMVVGDEAFCPNCEQPAINRAIERLHSATADLSPVENWPQPISVSGRLPEMDAHGEVDTVLVWYMGDWIPAKWEGSEDDPVWQVWVEGVAAEFKYLPKGSVTCWLPLPPKPE